MNTVAITLCDLTFHPSIESDLIQSLINNGDDGDDWRSIIISDYFPITKSLLDDFNQCTVDPSNINGLLSLCDYLLIDVGNTLSFVIKSSTPTATPYVLTEMHNGHYELPNFMSKKSERSVDVNIEEVMKHGSFSLLGWIKFYDNVEKSDSLCLLSCEFGYLDCLKYAHENGCELDEDVCVYASSGGHLDCLKYAHEHGCGWSGEACWAACDMGHLNCLKYAYEHGCPCDKRDCARIASQHGHLD